MSKKKTDTVQRGTKRYFEGAEPLESKEAGVYHAYIKNILEETFAKLLVDMESVALGIVISKPMGSITPYNITRVFRETLPTKFREALRDLCVGEGVSRDDLDSMWESFSTRVIAEADEVLEEIDIESKSRSKRIDGL